MEINIDKLKELVNECTVEVSYNGFTPFRQRVVNAEKLLPKLHEATDLSENDFVEYVNSGKYKESFIIKSIFDNVKSQGTFKLSGYEELGNSKHYIECKSLNWL